MAASLQFGYVLLLLGATAVISNGQAVSKSGCNCSTSWKWYNVTGYGYDDIHGVTMLKGCSNPDQDAKGAWCAVDPKTCPTYAGRIYNWNQTLHYDYCGGKRGPDSITQAQCQCLENWTWKYNATSSSNFSGCANPDDDPQGKWCPIDPKKCPGAYGNFTWQGTTYSYDYCGRVREYTDAGCLCTKNWSGYTMSRTHHSSCAWNYDYGSFYCTVDRATCKQMPYGEKWYQLGFDLCSDVKSAPTLVTLGSTETQSGCKCSSKWTLATATTSAFDAYSDYIGCQNPDKDTKGPWCIVDAKKCPSSRDNLTQWVGNVEVTSFVDYCSDVGEMTQAGCLCQGQWGPNGKYLDGCANPDNKTSSWCYIRRGSCKKGSVPVGGAAAQPWDYCGLPIPSPPPPGQPPSPLSLASNSTTGSQSSRGSTSTPTVILATPAPPKKSPVKYAVIIAPIATVLAALTTMAYTLYKCHKKHRFFQNHQVMKLAAVIGTQASASDKDSPSKKKPDQQDSQKVHVTQADVSPV